MPCRLTACSQSRRRQRLVALVGEAQPRQFALRISYNVKLTRIERSGCATTSNGDLASRLANRIQLTSDGHKAYLEAVEDAFGVDIDYAMLVKVYGASPESAKGRYSPAECTGAREELIEGRPDPKYVSTSFSERSNLTLRMNMRRFTWLTNAFSKKVENHTHAVALHMMYYNFVRIHQTLRTTPAMAAAVTKKLWEMTDVVDVLEAWKASKPIT